MPTPQALLRRRDLIARRFPPLTDLVRGSLIERELRCGKPSCRCARGPGHRVFYLTTTFPKRRTEQITVPKAHLAQVRRWLDNYQRLGDALEAVSAVNRQLLRARWLDHPAQAPRRR
jgi:hypothetical protein